MRLEGLVEAVAFRDLEGGDCYFCEVNGQKVFAVAIKAGQSKVAFIFSKGATGELPYVALDEHPYACAKIPHAEIQAEMGSLNFVSRETGVLISAAGCYYVKGRSRGGDTLTANLTKGIAEPMPQNAPFVSFSRWSAGLHLNSRFEPFFSFG